MVQDQFVGRWITFLATPLITLVSGFVALKANSWFDLNLAPADVAAYTGGVVLSIGTAVGVWLHNRGKYEIAELTKLTPEQVAAIQARIEAELPQPPPAPGAPRHE